LVRAGVRRLVIAEVWLDLVDRWIHQASVDPQLAVGDEALTHGVQPWCRHPEARRGLANADAWPTTYEGYEPILSGELHATARAA
jgi:hypothetical protein